MQTDTFTTVVIENDTLAGHLYIPANSEGVPVVIVLGGSGGGLSNVKGELLAQNGIAVLSLAYFRYKHLPETLDGIAVEYVINAINYLHNMPVFQTSKIGIWGASRGSELAFLAATHDSRIKSLVVTTPSKVAWHGATTPVAWTYNNLAVASLTFDKASDTAVIDKSSMALENPVNVARAQFRFEKINGPILLVSAERDQIWPSFQMARDIEKYLALHQFKHKVIHQSYPTGHTFSQHYWPAISASIVEHFNRSLR
ncbi:alpha/beta hydrolase family protein [Neptunicella sp. SCSIO 80796]|uniref:alpha/beta hydrolase family protein n=1 Tax=Neptunicella plasticusilytica TaxID=3117012 RepID=UPI003A4D58EA